MSKNKIRVGIWGLGRAGWAMHTKELDKFSDEYEIVAGCDLEQDRLDAFKKRYPDSNVYSDGNAFLADSRIELVSVTVRSAQHVDYGIRALEAGKTVFLEKPIAVSPKGLEKLEDAARKYPGKLYFRHNRRMEACFNHVLDIIHSGVLGDIYEIKLCRHSYQFRDDWQTLLDCAGGQLNNWGPHLIDQALQLLESPLKSIWSNLKKVAAFGDAEDHLKIIFQGENDRIIDVEISGGVALPSPVYAVYGTKGSLISENEQDIQLKYLDPEVKVKTYPAHHETPPQSGGFTGSSQPTWFRTTIMTKPANKWDLHDIYHKLYETIREGKPYPIKQEEAFAVARATFIIKEQNPSFKGLEDQFGL